jgi:hypothetical protein
MNGRLGVRAEQRMDAEGRKGCCQAHGGGDVHDRPVATQRLNKPFWPGSIATRTCRRFLSGRRRRLRKRFAACYRTRLRVQGAERRRPAGAFPMCNLPGQVIERHWGGLGRRLHGDQPQTDRRRIRFQQPGEHPAETSCERFPGRAEFRTKPAGWLEPNRFNRWNATCGSIDSIRSQLIDQLLYDRDCMVRLDWHGRRQ